jgi:uncharacterized protein (DUF302 family)
MNAIGHYAYQVELSGPISGAREQVIAALKEQGFGVLTEIDVQATLREKIGAETAPYRILGVCNPTLAHQALTATPHVGLMLPCTVTLREENSRTIVEFCGPRRRSQSSASTSCVPRRQKPSAGCSLLPGRSRQLPRVHDAITPPVPIAVPLGDLRAFDTAGARVRPRGRCGSDGQALRGYRSSDRISAWLCGGWSLVDEVGRR